MQKTSKEIRFPSSIQRYANNPTYHFNWVKIHKSFIKLMRFLKEKHAYVQFAVLLEDTESDMFNYMDFLDSLETSLHEVINYAFSWASTPQGHDYWCKLHYEWQDELDYNFKGITL